MDRGTRWSIGIGIIAVIVAVLAWQIPKGSSNADSSGIVPATGPAGFTETTPLQTQVTPGTPAPPTEQSQGSDLGDLNFEGYCMSTGYSGVELFLNNITGWKCVSGPNVVRIDVTAACQRQYGSQATDANYDNYSDPFSWYCSQQ